MVVLHIFISVAAPCDKSIVRAAIHRIPNFNLLSYKYRIQNYKITNAQIQNDRNKELLVTVTRALWQLLPTEFPSSICFPTNSTPLPKHNNNIFHNHKGIYQSHFHFAIGILHDNATMSNESKRTKRRPKPKSKCSITPPYGINLPLNCC